MVRLEREADDLRETVLHVQQTDHDAQNAQHARFAGELGIVRELTLVHEGAVIWEVEIEAVQAREPAYLFLAMSDKRFGQLGSSSSWRGESTICPCSNLDIDCPSDLADELSCHA